MKNEIKTFGKRLKEERKRREISREDFAKQVNISYSALAMYERGERNAPDILKIKMAKVLNISLDYLIGIIDNPIPYTDITEYLKGITLPNYSRNTSHGLSQFSKLRAELESNNIISQNNVELSDERIEAIVEILIANKSFIDILEKQYKENKSNN